MYVMQKNKENSQETSPIEFYKSTHTNREGLMTEKAQAAYVR